MAEHLETEYPEKKVTTNIDSGVPRWFYRLFIGMLVATVIALWLIPGEWLVHWSMWWNNISPNP